MMVGGVKVFHTKGNHGIKITNRCFENVVQFRYLGTTITNQNLIQEEIKRGLNFCHLICCLKHKN
jgi:hypothetical protein